MVEKLEPKEVFKYFYEISQIPRCSKQEQGISDYLVNFAKKRNLEVYRDDMLNVIIKKKATLGYENAPTVILQGHMDMVCEKNKSTIHNFETDPIKLLIDGDTLKADGTTLGADNGIAVAFCLAMLDSNDIPHPPLEIVITSQEEIGLIGASKLDGSKLEGKYLINIDAEDEGILFTSCAGGARANIELPIKWENINEKYVSYDIFISGLKGGHSGIDIDKSRANANKLVGRILNSFDESILVNSVNGGLKVNAIPREAMIGVSVLENKISKLLQLIDNWNKIFKNEFKSSDPNIEITIQKSNKDIRKVFSKDTLEKSKILYMLIPYGINTISADIEGLVESSSNLGIVTTKNELIRFENSCRSSVGSIKDDILSKLQILATITNASFHIEGIYPEWEYKKDSFLREKFIKIYKKLYNKKPIITALHAGLECGILGSIIKDADMISFGPNIDNVHTPDEKLGISSTKRTWDYLCEVLKEFK